MKLKYILLPLVLLVLPLAGCNDCDDDVKDVPDVVKAVFEVAYPEVVHEKWEYDNGYYKAEFSRYGVASEAWFTAEGGWVRTETDFYGALPQKITDYIETHYVGYAVDECDLVETPEVDYFDIELDRRGGYEVHLKMTEEGEVL